MTNWESIKNVHLVHYCDPDLSCGSGRWGRLDTF